MTDRKTKTPRKRVRKRTSQLSSEERRRVELAQRTAERLLKQGQLGQVSVVLSGPPELVRRVAGHLATPQPPASLGGKVITSKNETEDGTLHALTVEFFGGE